MIINPIIPIWLMGIYCIIILILLLYKKSKKDIKNNLIKILIVILLFTINIKKMQERLCKVITIILASIKIITNKNKIYNIKLTKSLKK